MLFQTKVNQYLYILEMNENVGVQSPKANLYTNKLMTLYN